MRWSYKTVHFELKKEGLLGSAFLDESEVEQSLNEYGKAGWELVSMLETMDGLIAVFKQPLNLDTHSFYPLEETAAEVDPKQLEEGEEEIFDVLAEESSEEVIILDECKVGEDRTEEVSATSKSPLDVGTIRIE